MALPQQLGFWAQTSSTHGSSQLVSESAAPVRQTEWAQSGGGQAPQSAAHEPQSSVLSQVPLPQHAPQAALAPFTHWLSHAVVQQYASLAQTVVTQALQPDASAAPVSQAACSQLVAQSSGQKTASSPGEHTPSPHTTPPLDEEDEDEELLDDDEEPEDDVLLDDEEEELLPLDELALDEEDDDELVVVAPPACVKRSSDEPRPQAPAPASAISSTDDRAEEDAFTAERRFMSMLPSRRLSYADERGDDEQSSSVRRDARRAGRARRVLAGAREGGPAGDRSGRAGPRVRRGRVDARALAARGVDGPHGARVGRAR